MDIVVCMDDETDDQTNSKTNVENDYVKKKRRNGIAEKMNQEK
jgi:hypothetical protein